MAPPKKVAVLGATGKAGQYFIRALDQHPWFQIVSIHGSSSVGKTYGEARKGFTKSKISDEIMGMKILSNKEIDLMNIDVVISAVPTSIAKNLELEVAAVKPVISTTSAYRYEEDMPIYLPTVNADHLGMIELQKQKRGWKGFILPAPSSVSIGISTTLYPIFKKFGLKSVIVTSMQPISSSGYPGVSGYDIHDNIIPYVPDSDQRIKYELKRILAHWDGQNLNNPDFKIDIKSIKVPILYGNTDIVHIETVKECSKDEIITAWSEYKFDVENPELELPNAPKNPIKYRNDPYRPQPRIDTEGNEMSVITGGLEETEFQNGFKFTEVTHNTELGVGRGGVLIGEFLIANNLI